jgi:hypothetical protein
MTTEDETPVRDAALDAAWRAHSLDEPPAHLDATILAAAHEAVAAGPREVRARAGRATSARRWWVPLATAAAIGGVVIGLSRLAPQDRAATTPYASSLPARDPAPSSNPVSVDRTDAPAQVPAPAAPAKRVAEAPAPVEPAHPSSSPAAEPSFAFVPSPPEAAAATGLEDGARREVAAPDATRAGPRSEPASTAAPALPPAPLARARRELSADAAMRSGAEDDEAPDVDAWIARIRHLYDAGKSAEAAKELTALRAAVPDADRRLPPDLHAWAATVEPTSEGTR